MEFGPLGKTTPLGLRIFFDPGYGGSLRGSFWTADADAHARFADHPVASEQLKLPVDLATRGEALFDRFDGCMYRNNPAVRAAGPRRGAS